MRATGRGVSKTPANTNWNLSTIRLCNNIPRNTPYRSAYVHGKMDTNGPIAKI